jgi:two-component system, LytTR family, response regulator
MRVLLVDDEPLAHVALRALLDRHPDIEVVGEALTGRDAIAGMREMAPDVVFLDIKMPGVTGFDLLRAAKVDRLPLVVMATAYEAYALDAFNAAAFDYLTKPISAERLGETLRRVRSALPERHATRLAVRVGTRAVVIAVDDIDWIAANDYCSTVYARGDEYVIREALASLGRRLDPSRFLRVHRQAIVNVQRIAELRPDAVVLTNGTRLAVSRRRRAALEALFKPS